MGTFYLKFFKYVTYFLLQSKFIRFENVIIVTKI